MGGCGGDLRPDRRGGVDVVTGFERWLLVKLGRRWMKELLMLNFLKGKRTYLAAAIIAVLTFLKLAGVIDEQQYVSIVGFLTSIGLVTAAVHQPKP